MAKDKGVKEGGEQYLSPQAQLALISLQKNQVIEDDMLTSEEALAKVSMKLADTPDEQVLSEFKNIEIFQLSALKSIADKYQIPVLKAFIRNFGRFRVSLERKGRGELVSLAKAQREELDLKKKAKNLLMFGRG